MTTKNKLNYGKKVWNYMYCQLPPPKVRGFVKSNYPFNWHVDKCSYRVCTKCIPFAFVIYKYTQKAKNS